MRFSDPVKMYIWINENIYYYQEFFKVYVFILPYILQEENEFTLYISTIKVILKWVKTNSKHIYSLSCLYIFMSTIYANKQK